MYVRDANGGGTYQFGWAQALTRLSGEWMFVFFENGEIKWWQYKRGENCFAPISVQSLAGIPCTEIGAPLPPPPGLPASTPITSEESAIYDAVRVGDLNEVKALVRSNPDAVFIKDNHGLTPLHWAAVEGNKDVAELLLASKADVNAKADRDWSPLHYATANDHLDVAQLLLINGANVNATDRSGLTPLHVAACWGWRDVAELLLANKANVNAKDNKGATTLYYATAGAPPGEEADGMAPPRGRHPNVAKLIKQHGGLGGHE